MNKSVISIIVPLYNEEQVFSELIERIANVIDSVSFSCNVYLINDGSTDRTSELIERICIEDNRFIGVFLSRNFGHQYAVTAGLSLCNGSKGVLIIDGDLQDPPELISDFYNLLNEGNDVIYAVRRKRKESFLKRFMYKLYYRLQHRISNFVIPIDTGDFSMLSRRVVDHFNDLPELDVYFRGMRAWIGFKQIPFEYERDERFAGETKYSWKKLFQLAFKGIFNFSDLPVRIITRMGFITVLISLIYFFYNVYRKIFYNDVPQGFTATILAIILFSGVQLISLGIIGEYVLRIFKQTQNRPRFIIDKIIAKKNDNDTIIE